MTEEKQTQAYQQGGDLISELWEWMSTTMWEKVTGFAGSLVDKVKDWWNNLSWDPRSWVGAAPTSKPTTKGTVTVNGKEMSLDEWQSQQQKQQQPKAMAEGGIVTEPTKALIGEAGPEAVIPLDKFSKESNISNDILGQIASNTGDTNTALQTLAQAIFKLAQNFEGKAGKAANIVINGGDQQSQIPSASQIAAGNNDPIRAIRMQFAV